MRTIALMRSPSVGVRPVVGSGVTSLTEKIPNCMTAPTFASIEVASLEAIMYNRRNHPCIPARADRVRPQATLRTHGMSPARAIPGGQGHTLGHRGRGPTAHR